MTYRKIACGALILLLMSLFSLTATAQENEAPPRFTGDGVEIVDTPEPRPSPLLLARRTFDDGTYVKVHYGAPARRDRKIFGDLVPLGEVWRTAANEATEILFTNDVTFGGENVPAGTYSLLSIPGESSWSVMLNSKLGFNGTGQYDEANNVASVTVPVTDPGKQYESFNISLTEAEGGADLHITWVRTRVTVPIRR